MLLAMHCASQDEHAESGTNSWLRQLENRPAPDIPMSSSQQFRLPLLDYMPARQRLVLRMLLLRTKRLSCHVLLRHCSDYVHWG